MNKILVDSSNNLIESGTYFLDIKEDGEILVVGDHTLTNIDNDNHNVLFNVLDNSNTILYKVNNISKDTTVNICIHDKCHFELNLLLLNTGDNTFTLNIEMIDNDSFCKIKARVLNVNNDKLNFICNGKIIADTFNNELVEDLKGLITSNDIIKISPNIEAETSELVANHLVTIGTFLKDELFYLNSKGICDKTAKKMLTTSFINEVINDDLKEKIKTEVIILE